jgi:hypothetical protein
MSFMMAKAQRFRSPFFLCMARKRVSELGAAQYHNTVFSHNEWGRMKNERQKKSRALRMSPNPYIGMASQESFPL